MANQNTHHINRRDFIMKTSAAVAGTGLCICGIGGCATLTGTGSTPQIAKTAIAQVNDELVIDVTKVAELSVVGGAVKIAGKNNIKPIIIARVNESSFVVASLVCPHRGVEMEYENEAMNFSCASLGNSTFKLDGEKVSGPAKNNLQIFSNIFADGKLTISGVIV
ncbi:MAG: Rieske 2Fe-2S domain-containing protein [Deltaproteobacteria bacterium]|nr:Rieske 2Fe-2S domain-containing protein [Deltaproteobacteria bacterium]